MGPRGGGTSPGTAAKLAKLKAQGVSASQRPCPHELASSHAGIHLPMPANLCVVTAEGNGNAAETPTPTSSHLKQLA